MDDISSEKRILFPSHLQFVTGKAYDRGGELMNTLPGRTWMSLEKDLGAQLRAGTSPEDEPSFNHTTGEESAITFISEPHVIKESRRPTDLTLTATMKRNTRRLEVKILQCFLLF